MLKSEATKTIIYLTIAYIVFNIPLIVVCILESITVLSDFKFQIQQFGLPIPVLNFIYTLIGSHAVALNSTTNVVIYFCRKDGLRKFYWKVLTCNWHELVTEGANVPTSKKFGVYKSQLTSRANTMEFTNIFTPKVTTPVNQSPQAHWEPNLEVLKRESSIVI